MKLKKIHVVIFLAVVGILIYTVWYIRANTAEKELDLTQLKSEDIEKIHGYFYTGSDNRENDSSVDMTREQVEKFTNLMNRVNLTAKVSEEKAQSNGASVTYTLTMKDGTEYVLRPGQYFQINHTYYKFQNSDRLWDEIVAFKDSW